MEEESYLVVWPPSKLPDHVTGLKAKPSFIDTSLAGTVDVKLTASFAAGYCLDYFTVGGGRIEGNSFCFKKSVVVGVVAKSATVPVTGVAFREGSAERTIYVGELGTPKNFTLTPVVTPEGATDKKITWDYDTSHLVLEPDASGSSVVVKGKTMCEQGISLTATAGGCSATVLVRIRDLTDYKSRIDSLVSDYETKASQSMAKDDAAARAAEYAQKIRARKKKSKFDFTMNACGAKRSKSIFSPTSSLLSGGVTGLQLAVKGADVVMDGLDVTGIGVFMHNNGAKKEFGGKLSEIMLRSAITSAFMRANECTKVTGSLSSEWLGRLQVSASGQEQNTSPTLSLAQS